MKIRDSVAFVTGANRGLGLSFVQQLLAGGARKVYATARNPDSIPVDGVQRIQLDVTDRNAIDAIAKDCTDVNLLINNAGITRRSGFLAPDGVEAARDEMETNFFGPLLLSRAFAPILAKNGGGAIVNVLSVLSWVSIPTSGSYGASKSAAWAMTNWMRMGLREQGTQVISVHVGLIDTDMAKNLTLPKVQAAEVVQQTLAAVEEGRSEVLADELSRQVKAHLSDDPGVYLTFDLAKSYGTAA